jgi:HAD superfamily hydrolase (TIGR01509 family)
MEGWTMANQLLPLNHIRNVIFDLDGTLVLSNDAHAHAFIDAFELHDIRHINFNDMRKMIGMNAGDILCRMLDEKTFAEKGAQIETDRTRLFQERYMEQVELAPGTLPLMELMRAHGIRMAISSASPRSIVNYYIARLGIGHLIEGSTSDEEVPEGKPNPVAIEVCCQMFDFQPSQTMLIGDSPYDILAATAFSITTVGVLTGGYTREELMKTGASAVYDDLNEIYRTFEQSVIRH